MVDNINRTADQRSGYIQIAKAAGIPIRCFFMDTDKDTCLHNNRQRKNNTHRDHLSNWVNPCGIHNFFKGLKEPSISEGFESIVKIDFEADDFQNDQDKMCWIMERFD